MTTTTRRAPVRRLQLRASAVALALGLFAAAAGSDPATAAATERASGAKASTKRAPTMANTRSSATSTLRTAASRTAASRAAPDPGLDDPGELSFSDEYERAELVERMLGECRGIAYNAYELARTSGESLWLPAPIQLFVVRVRHPYCAELLRAHAPKQSV